MDGPDIPADIRRKFHDDLRLIHRLMGNPDQIIRRLRGARSVIDIGCGDGELLAIIRYRTGAEVTGIDLTEQPEAKIPVVRGDATSVTLPTADAAVSMLVIHHLTPQQAVDLIRNVGRACRRFIILDLVRHPLPFWLYTIFMCPLLSRVGAADGRQSVRRAYTGPEMRGLVEEAIAGTGATFSHWVSRFYARQIVEITY
jgi:SAM-dependent methyltransferase